MQRYDEALEDFSIQGSFNISAAAGLRLRGEAGAGLEILDHDIKAGAGINAIAAIRGYAEATPIIGYREEGSSGQDKQGEFFIRGELEIAAQPFLGLDGDLFVELDSPWWSPAPDKKWTWPLGGKEWPMGSEFGIKASVDYVFGSDESPAIEFKEVDFSADKFLTDLYNDQAKASGLAAVEKASEWKEKNRKDAERPAGGKPGGDKPGEAAQAPPVQPAHKLGGQNTKKQAAPTDRTAEGKSVKELQDKAAKTGKKPESKESAKGAGQEEKGKKEKKKQDHDVELQKGLAALDAVTARYAKDGATKDEIVSGVKSVRRKFKVFKSLEVVDNEKKWKYIYVASKGEKIGPPNAEVTDKTKGTKEKPYWIKWHKPRVSGYPTIKIRLNPHENLTTVKPTKLTHITVFKAVGETKDRLSSLRSRLKKLEKNLSNGKTLLPQYDAGMLQAVKMQLSKAEAELERLRSLSAAEKRGKVKPQARVVNNLTQQVRTIVKRLHLISRIPEIESEIRVLGEELQVLEAEVAQGTGTEEKEIDIGVANRYHVQKGQKLQRHSSRERRTGKQKKFRDFLASIGHDLGENGQDAEHVTDLSLGGDDDFSNLWPLASELNPVPNQMINEETGKQVNVGLEGAGDKGRSINDRKFIGKWVIVMGFQR